MLYNSLPDSNTNTSAHDQIKRKINHILIAILIIGIALIATLIVTAKTSIESVSTYNDLSQIKKDDSAIKDYILSKHDKPLPRKYAVPFLTKRTYQEDRGTCWDFATINLLEVSYRKQAYSKGYLHLPDYLRLSQQAYGISMMKKCNGHEDICYEAGDMVALNSTEGGEIGWLYYLSEMYDQVLPLSVCNYNPDSGYDNEWTCDGMDDALKTNPLRYNINDMKTAYNVYDSKSLMYLTGDPLGWSSNVHVVTYYFPCSDKYWSATIGCNIENRISCPTDRNYNSVLAPCYNQHGEFYDHGKMTIEGGHAMNAVGWNDDFVTHFNDKGGFIIKNSWRDQLYNMTRGPRGSHSVEYFMQEISDWDERIQCPNPLNPDNWLSCISIAPGPTRSKNLKEDDELGSCLVDKEMQKMVHKMRQPVEFECIDKEFCSKDSKYRYFLKDFDHNVHNDLLRVTMVQYDSDQKKVHANIILPYFITQQVALIFKPVEWILDVLVDDEDICGYYFFPYSVGLSLGFYTTWLSIEWEDSSFEANAANYPNFDYSLVKSSTVGQNKNDFFGPYPNAKKRY